MGRINEASIDIYNSILVKYINHLANNENGPETVSELIYSKLLWLMCELTNIAKTNSILRFPASERRCHRKCVL